MLKGLLYFFQFQYLYLHEILTEAVHCGSMPVDLQVFPEYMEELNKIDGITGGNYMQLQYEVTANIVQWNLITTTTLVPKNVAIKINLLL